MAKTRRACHLLLRFLAFAATLSAVIVMATSHERTTIFTVSFEAKYTNSPAFKYFVTAYSVVIVYGFFVLFLPAESLLWRLVVALDLGMRKHKLLREDILPSMASNRKVQRLLNEFMDLLSEYDIFDANQEQTNLTIPKSSSPATNLIESSSLATTDHEHIAPPKLDHNTQLGKEQTNILSALTNEANADTSMTDQVNQDAQVKESA